MNLTVTVQPNLDRTTLRQIAELHRDNLPSGFLPSLGLRFLSCLYRGLRQYPGGILVICRDGNRTVGFVSGVDDLPRFYRWFLRHKLLIGAWAALPGLCSFRALRKALEVLRYPRKARQSLPDLPVAELVSLAVDPQYRRQGIAHKLYESVIEQLSQRRIAQFRIMVGHSQSAATVFYQRMGAQQVSQLEIHRNQASLVFVHSIEQRAVSAAGE